MAHWEFLILSIYLPRSLWLGIISLRVCISRLCIGTFIWVKWPIRSVWLIWLITRTRIRPRSWAKITSRSEGTAGLLHLCVKTFVSESGHFVHGSNFSLLEVGFDIIRDTFSQNLPLESFALIHHSVLQYFLTGSICRNRFLFH